MRSIVSLALLLLPTDAQPMGAVALELGGSWIIRLLRSANDAVRLPVSRVGLIALLVLAMTALPGLAYASPPDPSWIPGLYDDADHDDVVMLVTSATGNVGADVVADLAPILVVGAREPVDHGRAEHGSPGSLVPVRAPPAA